MPLTYHFKPFPNPGESHFDVTSQPATPELNATPCACQKDSTRCKQCRQPERNDTAINKPTPLRAPSQALLSPIKEHPDPLGQNLTPKQIRDQRRAANRVSVSAAFSSAVATEDYFPLFHSRAFTRSDSDSSSRSRSARRLGSSSSSSKSRSASPNESDSLPVPDLAKLSVQDEKEEKLVRRSS